MSIYYSKWNLNTYKGTPYFAAHCPADYPLNFVLLKCRAFRRLPPSLRELSALAKTWAAQNWPVVVEEMNRWYDAAGNELDPSSGKRLTDEQIDAQWRSDPGLDELKVEDIPVPEGGFPDPETWEPKGRADADQDEGDEDGPTEAQIQSDIAGHGRARVARTYGVPDADSDEGLVRAVLNRKRR